MTSKADVGGMAVEVAPSHQCSITCCCQTHVHCWQKSIAMLKNTTLELWICSSSVIVLFVNVVISMRINRKHYFQSDLSSLNYKRQKGKQIKNRAKLILKRWPRSVFNVLSTSQLLCLFPVAQHTVMFIGFIYLIWYTFYLSVILYSGTSFTLVRWNAQKFSYSWLTPATHPDPQFTAS